MDNLLFPDTPFEDFLFEVKYDGPSFKGVMEINALGKEILGFENCLRKIISTLREQKKIDIKDYEFSILVEAFENNCFKKRIKILKFIEEHPETMKTLRWLIGGVFGVIITTITSCSKTEVEKMSPELITKIHDTVAISLLKNKEFQKSLVDIVSPLSHQNDKVFLKKPFKDKDQEICIDYSQKEKFLELTSEEQIRETEIIRNDEVYGRIISMDLDATKNQIDFKVEGAGERIHCSFPATLDINEYTHFLGKWVTISGSITVKNDAVTHIEIEKIKEAEPPLSAGKKVNMF